MGFLPLKLRRTKLSKPILAILFVLCVTVSCTKPNPTQSSDSGASTGQARHSVDVVKATAKEVTIQAGADGEAIVQLYIQNGYHINANPPTFPYLKATEMEISQGSGITVASIVYPNPVIKSFAFAEKPLAIYQGESDIKAKVKVAKTVRVGRYDLPANVQVQACDDQVCYAPGTLQITIPLIVK
jgi:hypothetical protein